jgi:hypothetical protein
MPILSRGDGTYTGKVVSGAKMGTRRGQAFEYFTLSAIDAEPLSPDQPLLTVTCELPIESESKVPTIGSFQTVEIHGTEQVSDNTFRNVRSAIGTVLSIKKADAKSYDPSMWKMRVVVNDGKARLFTPRNRLLVQDAAN